MHEALGASKESTLSWPDQARRCASIHHGTFTDTDTIQRPQRPLSRYSNPGPIQFIGPTCDANHATLDEAGESYGARLERLHEALEEVKNKCRPGCPNATVDTALMMAESLSSVLDHTVQ